MSLKTFLTFLQGLNFTVWYFWNALSTSQQISLKTWGAAPIIEVTRATLTNFFAFSLKRIIPILTCQTFSKRRIVNTKSDRFSPTKSIDQIVVIKATQASSICFIESQTEGTHRVAYSDFKVVSIKASGTLSVCIERGTAWVCELRSCHQDEWSHDDNVK